MAEEKSYKYVIIGGGVAGVSKCFFRFITFFFYIKFEFDSNTTTTLIQIRKLCLSPTILYLSTHIVDNDTGLCSERVYESGPEAW